MDIETRKVEALENIAEELTKIAENTEYLSALFEAFLEIHQTDEEIKEE